MPVIFRTISLILLTILLASRALADGTAMQSDWLELVKGSKGGTMGVELISIEDDETPGMQRIMLAVPKSSVGAMDTIEEVVVIGKRPEKAEPLDVSYEWVEDYDNDNYGLLIHLSKDSNWPIRLYVNSEPGFIR